MSKTANAGTGMWKDSARASCRVSQILALAGAAFLNLPGPAMAGNVPQGDDLIEAQIGIEINRAEESETGCRITFLTTSKAGDLARLSLELAFFDGSERLARLATLAFGEHLEGRPKVSQFTLEGLSCTEIRSAFVNSESACEGARPGSCLRNLETSTRTEIGF